MSATGRVIQPTPPAKRTIGTDEVLFPRLLVKDVVNLCELAYQHQRAAILEDKESGVDVKAALDSLRGRRGDLQLLWRYIWTLEGATAIVKASNAQANLDGMELWDICKLAGEACGFDMSPIENAVKAESAKDNGDGFVRPQAPAADGNT